MSNLFIYIMGMNGEIAALKPVDSKSLLPIIKDQCQDMRDCAYTEMFDPDPIAKINARAVRNKTFKLIRRQ